VSHPNAIELADIAQLIDNGRIKPFVQSSYPLNEAAKAQDHLEHDHARGKTVLKVAND
jgi:NADPH:quinone reductase-like Zn-dependent oxidoreductase